MAVTDADVVAVRVFPVLRRLLGLRESGGWFFQPLFSDSRLLVVAGARLWPGGWSDAIAIRTETDAKGLRCDPVGGVVWNREGGVADVLDGLLELPAPHEPNAPRLVTAHAPRLWVP
ncbi:hypothetical protein [Amycolatopsis pigmentata]|uniref:Uncharacterized protein n=1 Tax=Amycolatopsis pigmentata TaxID=450801 RepID=A0ABW5FV95_9PSEU